MDRGQVDLQEEQAGRARGRCALGAGSGVRGSLGQGLRTATKCKEGGTQEQGRLAFLPCVETGQPGALAVLLVIHPPPSFGAFEKVKSNRSRLCKCPPALGQRCERPWHLVAQRSGTRPPGRR